ncbi:MAG: sulfatase [Candidatus Sumerlaeaceae bacterium]|nr:sulfatase [Candidatus Sumerlaeaceae bacterium]
MKFSIPAMAAMIFAAVWQPSHTIAAAKSDERPNIIFIMSDDHGSQAISCYGSKVNKTPNIDRIAANGMKLENCFCTNALCAPSRAAILTSKYSHLNGVFGHYGEGSVLDGSQLTFPKLLQKAGYATAIIGKWHLWSDPTGFDYWNILPGQGAYKNPKFLRMGTTETIEGYVTDITTDLAIDYMKKRDAKKPFMMMVHNKAPHRTWVPDEKHAHMYDDVKFPHPPTFDDDYTSRSKAAKMATMSIKDDLTSKDLKGLPPPGLKDAELKDWNYQKFMRDYLGCVASVDDNVGRLLDYLKESGLEKNTVVIYTSDQGMFLGEHGWFDKRFMYEESIRMPFVIQYPKEIKPGSVSKAFVSNVDFAPTFLDYAGVKKPAEMQGTSFRPVLDGKTPKDWNNVFYYHFHEFPEPDHHVARHFGVRTDRYKLIRYYFPEDRKGWELFDLQKDPLEMNNVYNDPAYKKTVAEMTRLLKEQREKYKDTMGSMD